MSPHHVILSGKPSLIVIWALRQNSRRAHVKVAEKSLLRHHQQGVCRPETRIGWGRLYTHWAWGSGVAQEETGNLQRTQGEAPDRVAALAEWCRQSPSLLQKRQQKYPHFPHLHPNDLLPPSHHQKLDSQASLPGEGGEAVRS